MRYSLLNVPMSFVLACYFCLGLGFPHLLSRNFAANVVLSPMLHKYNQNMSNTHMGGISQGVRCMKMMSYFLYLLALFLAIYVDVWNVNK